MMVATTLPRSTSLLALVSLLACSSPSGPASAATDGGTADAPPVSTVRVLFIGNSYTSVNDLPAVVASLSRASQSAMRFDVGQHTPGGQDWEGHDADPAVDELIRRGWDYVVLQDQSMQPFAGESIPPVKAALLSLDAKIRATGARTVLYMTWARRAGSTVTDDVRYLQDLWVERYYDWHADAVGALVAPVGRAWERALRNPEVILHQADGSHPNALGTYLAACVFYATMTGQSPVGLGNGGLDVGEDEAAGLQRVAWETLQARKQPDLPLLGWWPLSSAASGSDLVPTHTVALGDGVGPDGSTGSATTFALGKRAVLPFFPGINAPNVTVSFYAHRADWSAPVDPVGYLVSKLRGYEIYLEATTVAARIYTVDHDASAPPIRSAVDALAPGWHHFALTYDGTTYALWIDGGRVASATTSSPLRYYYYDDGGYERGRVWYSGIFLNAEPYAEPVGYPSGFAGALADLRVYDRALTAAELETL